MKSSIRSAVAAIAIAVVAPAANAAATVSNDFTVSVNLLSQCSAVASGTQTMDFGDYTAITGGAATPAPTLNIDFNCTRNHVPASVAFDAVNGTVAGGGVLVGLNYDINVDAGAINTAGTAATSAPGGTGSADLRRYVVTGSMPANQAGTCVGTSCAGSHTRTLILTF